MKYYIRKQIKPSNETELVDGVRHFWRTRMTAEKCNRYMNHKFTTIPAIVLAGGRASGY